MPDNMPHNKEARTENTPDMRSTLPDISRRLNMTAQMVSKGLILADIGTDHAYVPIYLVGSGHCPSAIGMDVRPGPLEQAREHVRLYGLEEKIELRLSDGMEKLNEGEAQSAVISGMGGALTIRILEMAGENVKGLCELILQPQSEIFKVRQWLSAHDWQIVDEEMLLEEGKFYQIIKARRGSSYDGNLPDEDDRMQGADDNQPHIAQPAQAESGSESERISAAMHDKYDNAVNNHSENEHEAESLRAEACACYGPVLLQKRHPVLAEYLAFERRVQQEILENLEKAGAKIQEERKEKVAHVLQRNAWAQEWITEEGRPK